MTWSCTAESRSCWPRRPAHARRRRVRLDRRAAKFLSSARFQLSEDEDEDDDEDEDGVPGVSGHIARSVLPSAFAQQGFQAPAAVAVGGGARAAPQPVVGMPGPALPVALPPVAVVEALLRALPGEDAATVARIREALGFS